MSEPEAYCTACGRTRSCKHHMREPLRTLPSERAMAWLRRTCTSSKPCRVRYRAGSDREGLESALKGPANEQADSSGGLICSVMSDLHLEFHDIVLPGGGILLLAGDIFLACALRKERTDSSSAALRKRFTRFAREELSKYKKVFVVLGNHEHYRDVIEEVPGLVRGFLAENAPNATLLDDAAEIYEGVQFVGSTLWATYGAGTPSGPEIGRGMNDCQLIRTKAPLVPPESLNYTRNIVYPHGPDWRPITVDDIATRHREALSFLRKSLEFSRENGIPAIVMTHHAPSYLSKTQRFKYLDNGMDEAYYSNQHKLIEDNPHIKVFIHGHTHDSCRFMIGSCIVMSNQRGYFPSESRSRDFDPKEQDFDLLEMASSHGKV
jgi:Calcineurin-like phosphoesterase